MVPVFSHLTRNLAQDCFSLRYFSCYQEPYKK